MKFKPFSIPLALAITITPTQLTMAQPSSPPDENPTYTLLINEILAVNDAGLTDEDGDHSDWLELFNYGPNPIDLTGCFLTDDQDNPTQWEFPESELAVGDYLVVFLSGKDRRNPGSPFHTSFSLSGKGEFLGLYAPDGKEPIHLYSPDYPKQSRDTSFGIAPSWRPSVAPSQLEAYLLHATPGAPNADTVRGPAKAVKFNVKRGWHQAPFRLKLKSGTRSATIRYTTDGTSPTREHGILYEGPITVDHSAVLRAIAYSPRHRASAPTTRTFLFVDDVIRQSPDGLPPTGFPYHWGENKVDYGMDPAVVNDPRFEDEIAEGFLSLPSFSVVMNADDLFGTETGIYSHAEEDGIDWERPCSLELIHGDGKKGFQVDCGIRIRGGFSRRPNNPKHSFRLFFRDRYGPGKLEYPIFGKKGAESFDNLDLRTFQNYGWHMGDARNAIFLRDQFTRDLQLATDQPAARGDYCHLFINGHYWGLYNTCERIKAGFGVAYFGGKKKDYDAIKKGRAYDPKRKRSLGVMANDGNLDAWEQLWEAANRGLKNNTDYFRLQGKNPDGSPNESYEVLLDVDNLIDYMLVIFYSGNYDGPVSAWGSNFGPNNWYGLRKRTGREGFQFFIWDAEHTYRDVREDRTGPFPAGGSLSSSNPQWLWQQCLENAEFRVRVGDRILKHCFNDGVLTAAAVRERFVARAAEIESAVICESARWGDSSSTSSGGRPGSRHRPPHNRDDHWRPAIKRVAEEYIPRRTEILLAQLYTQGVISDTPPPVVRVSNDGHSHALVPGDRGEIIYTVDGSDPRAVGGDVSASAHRLPATDPTLPKGRPLHLRVNDHGDWSALVRIP